MFRGNRRQSERVDCLYDIGLYRNSVSGQYCVNAGDVVEVDFCNPVGSEAVFVRPAVVVTADALQRSSGHSAQRDDRPAGVRTAHTAWARDLQTLPLGTSMVVGSQSAPSTPPRPRIDWAWTTAIWVSSVNSPGFQPKLPPPIISPVPPIGLGAPSAHCAKGPTCRPTLRLRRPQPRKPISTRTDVPDSPFAAVG